MLLGPVHGPRKSAGQGSNLQADGTNLRWVELERLSASCTCVFASIALQPF